MTKFEKSNFLAVLILKTLKFDEYLLKYLGLSGAKASKSCRSRQELSNEYLLAKIGVDTAENETLQITSDFPCTSVLVLAVYGFKRVWLDVKLGSQ